MENQYFTYQRVSYNVFKVTANLICLFLFAFFTHNLAADTFSKIEIEYIDTNQKNIKEYRAMLCLDSSQKLCCEFRSNDQKIVLNPNSCTKEFDFYSAKNNLSVAYISILNEYNESDYFYPKINNQNLKLTNATFKVKLLHIQK